ncbi:MAG: tryptophan synthase subunit beta, partial [Victivallales bacterium]|nr:tryptophan synthase subunit beta [Victivallales bacterium]
MDTHYGIYGGQYVPETLTGALRELEKTYLAARDDPFFRGEFNDLLVHYVGRESPLYFAKRLSEHLGGSRIFLKREDLNHT